MLKVILMKPQTKMKNMFLKTKEKLILLKQQRPQLNCVLVFCEKLASDELGYAAEEISKQC